MTENLIKLKQITNIFSYLKKMLPQEIISSPVEWAERFRFLSKKVTSNPGFFSFDKAPFCREILECFAKNNPIEKIAVMKGVQLGFTTSVFENVIGWIISCFPGPTMIAIENKQKIKDYKRLRIDELIDSSELRDKIAAGTENKNSRRTGDTSTLMEFFGGFLRLCGANTGSDFSTFSVNVALLDEIDRWPLKLKNEGEPIPLAEGRTSGIDGIKKIGYISSPTLAHLSKIYEYYLKGDQRKYLIPCVFCGAYQELVFYEQDGGLYSDDLAIGLNGEIVKPYGLLFSRDDDGDVDYDSVVYRCKHCGEDIDESYKLQMLRKGYWQPTAKAKEPNYRSYHISSLYSVSKKWWEVVKDFISAGNNPGKLQTFYNQNLGLPFEDTTVGVDKITANKLRDENQEANIPPEETLFLTAACDVQDDRLEVEIKAWGDRWRNCGLDYRVIPGNPSDLNDECWQKLALIISEDFADKKVELMVIDSGDGEVTETVYSVCEIYGQGYMYPSKGFGQGALKRDRFRIAQLKNRNLPLIEICVDEYKNQLARWFAQEWRDGEAYPEGWVSLANNYPEKYLTGLTKEKKVKERTKDGRFRIKWVCNSGGNEPFDLCVYNLCAAEIIVSEIINRLKKTGNATANARDVFEYLKGVYGYRKN